MRNKTLAGMTRLNLSSIEAESQNAGMFLKHSRTNKRKPNLPVAVWCFHFYLFTHWHYYVCRDWILWGLATQVTQKRTFWKRCLDSSSSVVASRLLSTLVCHHLLSTLVFPLRINTFLFDILNECLVLFYNNIMKLMSWETAWQVIRCLTGPLDRLLDGISGQSVWL